MADVAIFADLANMVRLGTIVEIDSEKNTAVVSVNEFSASSSSLSTGTVISLWQSTVRRTVHVLNRGSKKVKDYFNYAVGEQVICVFPPTLSGGAFLTNTGYICGSFYNENNPPPAFFDEVRMLDFGIGNVTINLEDKSLDVEFDGDISINGKSIFLNG